MPTWPVSLPQRLRLEGAAFAPQPNVISFGTEVGPGKARRRSTARVTVATGAQLHTQAQLETFLEFFRDDLEDGALTFTWVDHVEGGAADYRFSPSDPYRAAPAGNELWLVTLNLLQVP